MTEAQSEAAERASSTPAGVLPHPVLLDLFDGPLDLLLHLIKKNEVSVTDIPVAQITEQYLSCLEFMRGLSLDVAGEYLVMAATLMLIKSRMLLPAPEPEDDEEDDPRADLVRQLLEYQRYREAAQKLEERPRLQRDLFTREAGVDGLKDEEAEVTRVRVTAWELLEAFRGVLARARPEALHHVATDPVTLRECIDRVLYTLRVARTVRFDSLFDENTTRVRIIVTFLAILELTRLGVIEAAQEERFGPIMVILLAEDVSSVETGLIEEYEGDAGEKAVVAGMVTAGQGEESRGGDE